MDAANELVSTEKKALLKEELDSTTSPKKSKTESLIAENDKKIEAAYHLFMIKDLEKNEIMNAFK